MYGSRFAGRSSSSRTSVVEQRARRKENQCRIYGHTAGKIRCGTSMFCSVCGKRFSAN